MQEPRNARVAVASGGAVMGSYRKAVSSEPGVSARVASTVCMTRANIHLPLMTPDFPGRGWMWLIISKKAKIKIQAFADAPATFGRR